jgi:hypothetical protein
MEFFETFGLREGVIGMAALIGIYAGIIIIRLSRVSQKQPPPTVQQDTARFGEQIFRSGVDAELKEMREEIQALRGEVDKLKAARNVSPQYGDAVALAQQGLDATAIAERCGISVAEAEMVLALSSGRERQA